MSNVTIGWNNATPTDSDLVGQGDDVIRSIKSNVQAALDAEHFFPSAGGAAGAHRRGSARIYVGPSSEVSSADTDGRMMFNTSTNQLNYLSSTSSTIVGGRSTPHFIAAPSTVSRYFAMDSGTTVINNNADRVITMGLWPAASFVGDYKVFLSIETVTLDGKDEVYAPFVTQKTPSTIEVYWGGVANNSVSTAVLNWLAIGERAYP